MRWIGMLLPAVCACRLFGAEPLKGCLAAIQTAVAHSAAGRWSESERELAGIIAEALAGNRLCLGIATGNLAVLLQRRGDIKGAETFARQSVAALGTGPEFEMALTRRYRFWPKCISRKGDSPRLRRFWHGWSICPPHRGTGPRRPARVP